VLTGIEDFGATVSAINEAEVFRFLRKPLDPETLRAAIEEALGRADMLHQAKGVQESVERRRVGLIDLETDFPGISLVALGPKGYFIPLPRLKTLVDRLRSTPLGETLAVAVETPAAPPAGDAKGDATS
jgi:hypothetical protein